MQKIQKKAESLTDTIYPVDTRHSTKGKTEVKVWNLIPSDRRDTTIQHSNSKTTHGMPSLLLAHK